MERNATTCARALTMSPRLVMKHLQSEHQAQRSGTHGTQQSEQVRTRIFKITVNCTANGVLKAITRVRRERNLPVPF